jgi:hypothetical protein
MTTFWMSFTDGDDGHFLGVSIVEVSDDDVALAALFMPLTHPNAMDGSEVLYAAVTKARETGCNPGGQIASWVIPDEALFKLNGVPRHTLLSRDDLERFGQEPLSLKEIEEEDEEEAALWKGAAQ